MNELILDDISKELLILNKHTIDSLFALENCDDCIALYVFYYKTAKWQETNTIKATDEYVKKSLKWGYEKIRKTKEILKEKGLIQLVQNRKNGKIDGWFIQISYLVSQEKIDKIKVINNTQKQELLNPTSSEEEINALKYNINILKNNINMLKEENNKLKNEIILLKEKYKKEKNVDIKTEIQKLLDYWNSKGIIKHKLNDDIKKAIDKALKEYSVEDIKISIDHYKEVLDSNYFFNYKWSIVDFLNRKGGFKTFLDDGSNWVNYCEFKSKPKTVMQVNGLPAEELPDGYMFNDNNF